MTLANAKVLHKHFLTIGRLDKAKQLVVRHPELGAEEPKAVKPDGKKPKRRTN